MTREGESMDKDEERLEIKLNKLKDELERSQAMNRKLIYKVIQLEELIKSKSSSYLYNI